jgi:hypothetical protein
MLATIWFRIFCLPRFYEKNVKIEIYRTIILPAVLYGCEIWCFIVREEYRLRVPENRVLRRIFEHKTGGSNSRLEKTA